MSAATFSRDLGRFTALLEGRSAAVFTKSAVDAQNSIRFGSTVTGAPALPVDTGYLRASVVLDATGAPLFPVAVKGAGPNSVSAEPVSPATLGLLAKGVPTATISTNAAYAEPIEYRHKTNSGGWRATIAGWPALVRQAAAAVGGGR